MTQQLDSLLAPMFEEAGYDVVRIRVTGGEQRKTLQIMAERKDRKSMTVDDCAKLSRMVSPVLDEQDPISGRYTLEVSSPGLDRPLVKLDDFDRFKGFEARVDLAELIDGRKRFRARVSGVQGTDVVLATDKGDVVVPFGAIDSAKLILTDELIEAFAPTDKE